MLHVVCREGDREETLLWSAGSLLDCGVVQSGQVFGRVVYYCDQGGE